MLFQEFIKSGKCMIEKEKRIKMPSNSSKIKKTGVELNLKSDNIIEFVFDLDDKKKRIDAEFLKTEKKINFYIEGPFDYKTILKYTENRARFVGEIKSHPEIFRLDGVEIPLFSHIYKAKIKYSQSKKFSSKYFLGFDQIIDYLNFSDWYKLFSLHKNWLPYLQLRDHFKFTCIDSILYSVSNQKFFILKFANFSKTKTQPYKIWPKHYGYCGILQQVL